MRLAKERRAGQSSTERGIRDVARNVARGLPLGSYLDEGLAYTQSDVPYGIEKATQNALNKISEDESTSYGELPYIGEVKQSGVNKLIGAVASAPFTPMIRAGGTFANMLATGAAYGGLYGSGEGDSATERLLNAAGGAAAGGAFGGALGGATALGTRAYQAARDAVPVPQAVRQYAPGARERVGRAVMTDTAEGDIARRQQRMGDRAFLADLGENVSDQANAIAASGGEVGGRGSAIIRRGIRRRDEQSGDVLQQASDAALGRYRPAKQTARLTREAANRAARPFYRQFEAEDFDFTGGLGEAMRDALAMIGDVGNKGQASALMRGMGRSARRIANKEGRDTRTISGGQIIQRTKKIR